VKRLKKCHSPGIDDITGEMIQAGGEKKFIEESYAICNQMWKEGSIAGNGQNPLSSHTEEMRPV